MLRSVQEVSWSLMLALILGLTASADGIGTRLDELPLRDSFGKIRSIREFSNSKILVMAFLGTECPLAKLYGPKLQELSKRYTQDQVALIGVFSNVQDSLGEVVAYGNHSKIEFPLLMDSDQELADLVKAKRTPEVVVLDANRNFRYQGRIDDQFAISIAKKEASTKELVDAIESVLADKAPDVASAPAVGCIIGRKNRILPRGDITYSKHIAPILNARCVECHRAGEIAPFGLTSFQETVGWEAMIAEVIQEERMPPWNANPKFGHFKNDARLSPEEKQRLITWIENGCPEGDPQDLPSPPRFAKGWRMPEPDVVIPIRETPVPVNATGVMDYQYFQVDPKFTENKYVIAAEARPGNTSVVHHIIAFLLRPGQKQINLGTMLIGYAPGTSPLIFPEGSAMRVPAGSQILFEVHYTPNGTAQTDQSYIGLQFTDADSVQREVVGLEALNQKFRIPAGMADHEVKSKQMFREDLELLSLTPHMHLRGKTFRYDATYPDGSTETLLDVPRYDFNWQLRYEFAVPKKIPKGTVVECVATFDNSTGNPNNPDPTRSIRWGQQSWDEMMIGFFTAVKPTSNTTLSN